MENNVLIIGSEGYIGSRLLLNLSQYMHVDGCDRERTVGNNLKFNIDYDQLKIEDLQQYDTVILLAGNSSVKSCLENFIEPYTNNVTKFVNLLAKLEALRNRNLRFIYASSGSVYGRKANLICDEDLILDRPITNYDLTKQMIDGIANAYVGKFNIYGLRFGTVCGYSPNMRWDTIINSMFKSAKDTDMVIYSSGGDHRGILAISDLCDFIFNLIDKKIYKFPSLINVSSMNNTIRNIAYNVYDILLAYQISSKLQLLCNEKASSSLYDFQLSTKLQHRILLPVDHKPINTILGELIK